MNRKMFALLAICLVSPVASSQTATRPVVAEANPTMMGTGCPVGLQAQPHGSGAIIETRGERKEIAQKLRLYWENRREKGIASATILVRGYDTSLRVIPAGSTATPALTKSFRIATRIAGHSKETTELTAQRFATVRWIDLKSIEYTDGTQWSLPKGELCRISPSRFIRIGAE